MIKFLPLYILSVSHRIAPMNQNAVYCLQISALVPEIFRGHKLDLTYIRDTICKYESRTLKVAGNAVNIGEVWNPVCCHGNKTFKLVLWSTFSRILLQRIKHFCYKLAEISFFHHI